VNSVQRKHFPDEVIANARALMLLGYNSPKIATELAVLFPEHSPEESTVRRWRQEFTGLHGEQGRELRDAELRIALRVDAIVENLLDDIEAGGTKLRPSEAMVMWGISRSKLAERAVTEHRVGSGSVINIMPTIILGRTESTAQLPGEPVTIEGEFVEIEPSETVLDQTD